MSLSNRSKLHLLSALADKRTKEDLVDNLENLESDLAPILASKVWQATTEALTLYVAPTGDDDNVGTELAPFLTIQAALNSLPKNVYHPVLINVAAGNYAGFEVQGFTFGRADTATVGYIRVRGVLDNATLATGTATGTLSGVTTGDSSTMTYTVLTDSTQSWTVDELKGKFIEILTGTGSTGNFTVHPIHSNTATTITIMQTAATTAVAATYAIRDSTTIIDNFRAVTNFFGTLTSSSAGALIYAYGNRGAGVSNIDLRFENLKLSYTALAGTPTSGNSVLLATQTARTEVYRCQQTGLSALGAGMDAYNADLTVNTCSIGTGGVAAWGFTNGTSCTVSRCYIAASVAVQLTNATGSVSGSCLTGNRGLLCDAASVNVGSLVVQNCIHGIQTFGVDSSVRPGVSSVYCSGSVRISDCTNTAITLSGLTLFSMRTTALVGSGNLNGIVLYRGPRVTIGSTCTLTATAFEISIDGYSTPSPTSGRCRLEPSSQLTALLSIRMNRENSYNEGMLETIRYLKMVTSEKIRWADIKSHLINFWYFIKLDFFTLLHDKWPSLHQYKWIGLQDCMCCGYEGFCCLKCNHRIIIGETADPQANGHYGPTAGTVFENGD